MYFISEVISSTVTTALSHELLFSHESYHICWSKEEDIVQELFIFFKFLSDICKKFFTGYAVKYNLCLSMFFN